MSRSLFLTLAAALLLTAPVSAQNQKKSALDKAVLEAYVRHLYVLKPEIKVQVADPKPAKVDGFFDVVVHASLGDTSQDFPCNRFNLLRHLAAHLVGFSRTDDPHGSVDLGPSGKVRYVPPLAVTRPILSLFGRSHRKQTAGILEEVAPLVLEDHQRVLTVSQQEIEERGLGIETIGQKQLKRAGVTGQDAIQQAPGRRHLVFAGTLRFQIEQDAQLRTRQQLQSDIPMVVLNLIAGLGVNRPLQAS